MGAAGEEGAKGEEKDDIDHSERAQQHETRVHPGAAHTCGRGKRAGATRPCSCATHTGENLGPRLRRRINYCRVACTEERESLHASLLARAPTRVYSGIRIYDRAKAFALGIETRPETV